MANGQNQLVLFNLGQRISNDQRSKPDSPLNENKIDAIQNSGVNKIDALGLTARIAQQFSSFDGEAQLRKNPSLIIFSV